MSETRERGEQEDTLTLEDVEQAAREAGAYHSQLDVEAEGHDFGSWEAGFRSALKSMVRCLRSYLPDTSESENHKLSRVRWAKNLGWELFDSHLPAPPTSDVLTREESVAEAPEEEGAGVGESVGELEEMLDTLEGWADGFERSAGSDDLTKLKGGDAYDLGRAHGVRGAIEEIRNALRAREGAGQQPASADALDDNLQVDRCP